MVIVPYIASALVSYAFSYAVQWAFGKDTHQYGQKIGDTRVQVSTYGKPIALIFGAIRTAGNVIWAAPLRETAHTQSQGGKGSPHKQTYTSYTYSGSFAVSLCSTTTPDGVNTPILGIGRIWFDSQLVYNGSSTDPGTVTAGAAVAPVVYTGTETQNPDPTMQAYLGAGNVPAYRGQAYIVFNDIQLEKYGNRIPNVEVEVITTGTVVSSIPVVSSVSGSNGVYTITRLGNRIFTGDWNGKITAYDIGDPLNPAFLASNTYAQALQHLAANTNPHAGGAQLACGGNTVYVFDDMCNKLSEINTGYGANGVILDGDILYLGVFYLSKLAVYDVSNPASPVKLIDVPLSFQPQEMCKIGDYLYVGGSASNAIYVIDVSTPTAPFVCSSVSVPASMDMVVTDGNYLYAAHYGTSAFYVLKVNGAAAPTLIATKTGVSTVLFSMAVAKGYLAVTGTSSNVAQVFDVRDPYHPASIATNLPPTVPAAPAGGGLVFDGNYQYAADFNTGDLKTLFFTPGVVTAGTTTALSSIVSSLCARVGVTAVDVSQLTDTVYGYIVNSQTSARGAIEPLQKAFYFDAVESDDTLKFIKRGTVAPVVISEDDMAAHDAMTKDVPPTVELNRTQEMELPNVVNVSYFNSGNSYLQGAQYAKRQITDSKQTMDMQLPICMSDSKGKQVVDVNLYLAWAGRNAVKLQTGRKYGYLDPADVMQVTKDNGVQYNLLLLKRIEKPGGVIEWDAITDDPANYSQSAAASVPAVSVVTTVPAEGNTRLEIMDIPMLRDIDNDAGPYVAATGYLSGWSGGALIKSDDNVTFTSVASLPVPGATMGYTSSILGTHTGGNTFDEKNSVTVVLGGNATLASVQVIDVLNGKNACLIGNEIVQFRDAALIATNTYKLTGLLRGRIGTEQFIGTHAGIERFVLLNESGLLRLASVMAEIGLPRYYKGVSNYQAFSEAPLVNFTNTAASLKPLSPVGIGGGRDASGNITINWTRRTRIGGSWSNGTEVPLGEASESYSIDIMSGATVKRTLTSSTPTVAYTSAQQVTDFGSNQAAVTVNIYQISASVGRGFAGTSIV